MPATRKKAIALLTTAVGLLVVGIAVYRPLEARYWLWKLREGDESEKERAADRLAELGVEEAVPILIDLIPRQLPERDSARPWLDLFKRYPAKPFQEPYWLRALVKQEAVVVPYLQEVLKEEPVAARSVAVYILGKIGPPAIDIVPDLVRAARKAHNRGETETMLFLNAVTALEKISPGTDTEREFSHKILDSETVED